MFSQGHCQPGLLRKVDGHLPIHFTDVPRVCVHVRDLVLLLHPYTYWGPEIKQNSMQATWSCLDQKSKPVAQVQSCFFCVLTSLGSLLCHTLLDLACQHLVAGSMCLQVGCLGDLLLSMLYGSQFKHDLDG